MKKLMLLIAILALASLAVAQTPSGYVWTPGQYTSGTGIPFNIDKLGAHQNGGRGCVGCHAPHSGARGNGGSLQWDPTANSGAGDYVSVAVEGIVGDEVLWGQDLGPIYTNAAGFNFPTGTVTITESSPTRQITGIAMCLSCHDGNVAKGAMMTNQSFEQVAGLLPDTYGTQPIPTLLGADGGSYGNYQNDHPVGPGANFAGLNHGSLATSGIFVLTNGTVAKGANFATSQYEEFEKNYGLFQLSAAPSYAGWAVDSGTTDIANAYVVCTTCHTPHSMYTFSGTAATVKGVYPTYFFILAPYNPGADVANGTKASSATQFCRQCHFQGAGGANEASGISIPTAF